MQEGKREWGEGGRERGRRESSGYIILPQLTSVSWRFLVAACIFLVCFHCCFRIVVFAVVVVLA